jgi:hypothetical protein
MISNSFFDTYHFRSIYYSFTCTFQLVLKPIHMHFNLLFLSWRIDIIWISINHRLMSILQMEQRGSSRLILLTSSVESEVYDRWTYFWLLETSKQKHMIWNESHVFIKSHKTLCSQKKKSVHAIVTMISVYSINNFYQKHNIFKWENGN